MPHLRTALVLLGLAALAAAVAYSDPTGTVPRMYIPAPEHLTRKRQTGTGLSVDYVNLPPAQAVQDAVQFAFNILENTFVFTQPVLVRFTFTALGWNSSAANVLGACSPNQFAPCPPTAATTKFYPSALYKQIAGVSNVPFSTACSTTQPGTGVNWDILARFNSDAPFSFSGNPTLTQYDFVYTFLHEMIHGLGFSGGIQQNPQTKQLVNIFASWAVANGPRIVAAYDWLIDDANGNSPADAFVNGLDAGAFNTAYNTGALSLVTASSDALSSAVFRPVPYAVGSSWYHLSQAYLGTSDQMMTPSLSPGSIIHTPGVRTLRIMQEMGWNLQANAIPTAQQASTLTGNVRAATTTGSSFALTSAPLVALVALAALAALVAL